jgi:hypothetical protein
LRDIIFFRNSYLKKFNWFFVWSQHVSSWWSGVGKPLNSSYFRRYINPPFAVEILFKSILNLTMKLKLNLSFLYHFLRLFWGRYILRARWSFIVVKFVKVVPFIVVFFRLFAFFYNLIDKPEYNDSTGMITCTQKLTVGFIKC